MDRGYQAQSPIRSESTVFQFHLHSSGTTGFPIIAIAVIGILSTAFLLVSYYVFVIKCCLNWHRMDLLRRISLSQIRDGEDPSMVYSTVTETRGLGEDVIRSIPILQYKKNGGNFGDGAYCECAVCLNEFQEDEKLRIIPNCNHIFHIDCIDVWLHNNANCPLCRTSISSRNWFNQTTAPSPSPPQVPNPDNVVDGDEDYVVIELGGVGSPADLSLFGPEEPPPPRPPRPTSPPRKCQHRVSKREKKLKKVTSMGDECINNGGNDEQFSVKPIRRSFSMDSSADPHLYLAIQEAVKKKKSQQVIEVCPSNEGCSSRLRRSFFSFSYNIGSRNAISTMKIT